MKELKSVPQKHILVCVNERENEDCCKNVGGEQIYLKLKQYVNANGLVGRVWITRVKCLGFCNNVGTTITIYPECKWFTEVKEEDLNKITEYILK